MTSWPASRRLADISVRLLYMLAAIAMLWVGKKAADAMAFESNQHGQFSELRWLGWVGAGVLAGVMAGIAVRPVGFAVRGYRWGVALVLGVPPALLVFVWYAYFSGLWLPPFWTIELAGFAGAAPSVLVGIAIVAGLTSREADPAGDADLPSAPRG